DLGLARARPEALLAEIGAAPPAAGAPGASGAGAEPGRGGGDSAEPERGGGYRAEPGRGGAAARGGAPALPGPDEVREALARCGHRPGAAAAELGISRNTLYALMKRIPGLRRARDLSADEILACRRATGGDVEAMAEALQVSRRALGLRLGELEIDP